MTETPETEKTVTPPQDPSFARKVIMALLVIVALCAGALIQRGLSDSWLGQQEMTLTLPTPADVPVLSPDERASLDALPQDHAPSSSVPDDLQKMKDTLATLSAALTAMQEKLDKTVQLADAHSAAASVDVASVVAYIQLQRAALADQPFEVERQLMLKTASQDAKLAETLAALEPLAKSGAPSLVTLRAQWRDLAASAQAAVRQEAAQTWLDRLLATLKSVVSIKSLKNPLGDDLAFAAVDRDLEQGHLAAALEKVAVMPDAAQKVVAEWKERAASRLNVDTLLTALTTRLIERATAAP